MIISKAKNLIKNATKYNKNIAYGCTGYINNLTFIKSTDEIADRHELSINQGIIDEEAKYDGYYSIVSSEENYLILKLEIFMKDLVKLKKHLKLLKLISNQS